MKKVMAFAALATIIGFLAILGYRVPSLDLILVLVLTLGLAAYDMVTSAFRDTE
jgi:hypothetical protein